jgi:hypothetical protein
MTLLSKFSFGREKIDTKGMRNLNWLVGGLQLAQALLILSLSDPLRGLRPVTTNFLANNQLASQAAGHQVLTQGTHRLFDLNLAYVVAAFFIFNAVVHFLAATTTRQGYEAGLKKGVNHTRWVDIAGSSGLMMVAVALCVGVYDISSLLMILGLTALMGLTTALIEINKPIELNFWSGVVAGVLPWVVVLIYILGAHIWGVSVPGFAYFVAFSLFLLFGAIAANSYLQYKRLGHWENYIYGERAYILLIFVAATLLGWQVFFGTLR